MIRGTLAGIALVVFAMAFPSLAGAGWTAPAVVSGAGSSTSQTRVAGAADGSAWVIWKRDVGGFDVIQGTRVQADGTPGPIQTFSGPTSQATDPVVASRADGSAIVAWINTSALDDTVHSLSIAADGTLGPIVTRSAVGPAGQPAADISVAVGDDGTAGLAWRKFDGANWIAQAVKVAADGTSGAIHNLSEPTVSVNQSPDIAAATPVTAGQPNSYRIAWAQGAGPTSNVGSREISSADALGDLWLAFTTGGGDPFDVNIAYGSDGWMSIMWVRYREDLGDPDPDDPLNPLVPFYNWAAEWVKSQPGVPPIPGAPPTPISPVDYGTPYNLSALELTGVFGGQPMVAWVHDLNGGGYQVETGRLVPTGLIGPTYQQWADASGSLVNAVDPVIRGNASFAAASGWTVPGLLANQDSVAWSRFSNSFADSVTPTGPFLYTADPGFAVADTGETVAAFTAIDAGNVGTVRVMAFTDQDLAVNPDTVNFGANNIGTSSTRTVVIRSSGQTPNQITGISLAGPDAGDYELRGADDCLANLAPSRNCTVTVRFTPSATGTQTATVSVTSEGGNEVTNLTGSGLNQTRNRVSLNKRNFAARKGKVVRIRATVKNNGGVTSNNTRVCVNLRKRALKLAGNRCRNLGGLGAGATRTLNYRIRVTWRAQRGVKLPVSFVMRANNAVVRQAVAQVRRKGR